MGRGACQACLPCSRLSLARGGRGMCTALRLATSDPSGRVRGCTMTAVRLRYSFRLNSRKADSSMTGLVCALTDSRSHGHTRTWVQEARWGGSLHRRCPHTRTRVRGPWAMAVYSASWSQGVPASAVGPKLVGPAPTHTDQTERCSRAALKSGLRLPEPAGDKGGGGVGPAA